MPEFVSIIVHIDTTPELFIDKLLELDRVVESFHTIELQGHSYEYRMSFEHVEPKRWTGVIDFLVFEIPAKTQGWLRKFKFFLATDAPLFCIASMEISETTPSHICVDLFSNHLNKPAVYELVVGLLLDMAAYWPEINEQLEGIKEKLGSSVFCRVRAKSRCWFARFEYNPGKTICRGAGWHWKS